MLKKIAFILLIFSSVFAENLTLKQCVDIALENNPDIVILKNNLESSRSKIKEVRANYWPVISGNFLASRRVSPSSSLYGLLASSFPGLEATSDVSTYTAGLSLQQNIWDFGRTSSIEKQAKDNEGLSLLQLDRKKQEVIYNVRKSYYSLLLAKVMEKIIDSNLKSIESLLESTKERQKQGLATEIDVLNIESEYVKFKLEVKKSNHQVELTTLSLINLLGKTFCEQVFFRTLKDVTTEDFSIPEENPLGFKDFEECKNKAISSRFEFKELELQENLAQTAISSVYSEWLPVISGSASYDLTGNIFFPNQPSWSVGLNILIPLFSGFSSQARLEQSEKSLKNIDSSKKQLIQNIILQVKNNYYKVLEEKENIDVVKKKYEYLRKNFEGTSAKHNAGLTTLTELVEAQTKKIISELENQNAIYNYYHALNELEYSLGGIK
ncbi:MAG: TolC family protein [Candidatus Firestonebacteria bacterium]